MVAQASGLYNNHFKKWLKDNSIEMHSTHNEGKSVVAERFIRSLQNKVYKQMTAISKNVYFDVLDDIVDEYNNTVGEYNNTYHKTIKMKPIDVKNDSFAEYNEDYNEKNPKGYAPNWSEEIFFVKKIKNIVPRTYVISDLNREEIIGSFYEKELQKTNQKEFRIEKILKTKGNKSYVKWKGYKSSFNSWIDKKDLIK